MPPWVEPPERRCATRRRRAAYDRSKSEPSAATLASLSDCRTDTPPRSRRIHPCFAHAPSCLLVLSRDLPMIWLSSRCVIATLRLGAELSISAAAAARPGEPGRQIEEGHVLDLLAGPAQPRRINELEGDVGLAPQELQEVTPLDDNELAVGHGSGVGGARMAVEQGDFPNISPSLMMLRTTSRPSADATLILTEPASTPMRPVPGSPWRSRPARRYVASCRSRDARSPATVRETADGCEAARACWGMSGRRRVTWHRHKGCSLSKTSRSPCKSVLSKAYPLISN